MPHLRIIDDDVWQQVKLRQQATRRAQREGIDRARKPKFLIDTTKISDWASFHDVFSETFGFPDFYGQTWMPGSTA